MPMVPLTMCALRGLPSCGLMLIESKRERSDPQTARSLRRVTVKVRQKRNDREVIGGGCGAAVENDNYSRHSCWSYVDGLAYGTVSISAV